MRHDKLSKKIIILAITLASSATLLAKDPNTECAIKLATKGLAEVSEPENKKGPGAKEEQDSLSRKELSDILRAFLATLLVMTQSEHGIVGEVFSAPVGQRSFRMIATTRLSPKEKVVKFYERDAPEETESNTLQSLIGRAVETAQPLIANDVAWEPTKNRLPPGHLPIHSFLALPLFSEGKEMLGMIGLANRADGYDEKIVTQAQAFLETWETFVEAYRAQELRQQAERQLVRFFDLSLDLLCIASIEGQFRRVNPAFTKLLGFTEEELLEMSFIDLVHPDDKEATLRAFRESAEPVFLFQTRYQGKNGDYHLLEWTVSPLQESGLVHAVARDISERTRLKRQLQQAQKLNALGRLASGISHDFNNILTGILGFSEITAMRLPEHSIERDFLEQVNAGVLRAAELIKRILAFSRETVVEPEDIEIDPIVSEALSLLRASLPASIKIIRSLHGRPYTVYAVPAHIHQVVMNIATNAARAMKDSGGILDVSVEKVEIGDSKPVELMSLKNGTYLKLTISDTGQGISEKVRSRIFDPYFTTAENDEGSGLGLSIVHELVAALKGAISIQSELGQGSQFEVYLPISGSAEHKGNKKKIQLRRGSAVILLIDDEKPIRKSSQLALEGLGYTVVTAENGTQALELIKGNPSRFDLVICDHWMPDMTGPAVAAEIRKLGVEIPFVLYSGLNAPISLGEAQKLGIVDFLQKPASLNTIAKTIRKAFNLDEED